MPLLESAAAPPIRQQPVAATDVPSETPDLDHLVEQAITTYSEDYLLAQTMDIARRRARSDTERAALNVRHGKLLLTWARESTITLLRQHRLQVAISYASGRGLKDIADEAIRELQRIRPEELKLQPIRAAMWLPRDARERYLRGFTRSPMWTDALGRFLESDCPTGSYDSLVNQERALAKKGSLRRLFRRTELTREGRPDWTTSSDDHDQAAEIAWLASVTAGEFGKLLAEGLRRMAEVYKLPDEDALTEYLSCGGNVHHELSRSLSRALQLFWRGEFEAAIHLIVPKIEAAARALLLELDEPIYRIQIGSDPGGYGGLHGLLNGLQDAGMDPDWIYFLKWLLLGHPGQNVRNDLSHGLVFDPGPVDTALVLRAATLLVRLVQPDSNGRLGAARARDMTKARLRRPITTPVKWPTPAAGRAPVTAVANGLRLLAHALERTANAMAG